MDSIFLKNKKYIKASVIAKELGYTSDYIGQLCRGGKVEAELVGRTWYVADEAIREHKKNRYRSSTKATKRSLEKMVLTESSKSVAPRGYKVRVNYEADESALLPVPKKKDEREQVKETHEVEVVSDFKPHEVRVKDLTREPKTGTLRINLATEEPQIIQEESEINIDKPLEKGSVERSSNPAEATPAASGPRRPAPVRFTPKSVDTSRTKVQRDSSQSHVGKLITSCILLGLLIGASPNFLVNEISYKASGVFENSVTFNAGQLKEVINTLKNNIFSF